MAIAVFGRFISAQPGNGLMQEDDLHSKEIPHGPAANQVNSCFRDPDPPDVCPRSIFEQFPSFCVLNVMIVACLVSHSSLFLVVVY